MAVRHSNEMNKCKYARRYWQNNCLLSNLQSNLIFIYISDHQVHSMPAWSQLVVYRVQ